MPLDTVVSMTRHTRRGRRAMTLVEIALVLGLMALVAAMVLPKLDAGTGLGVDQQATTTASAALDTALAEIQNGGGAVSLDPQQLGAANGDIVFVAADAASTSTHAASVGSRGSKVAVAVVGDPATDACWYSWRDLAAPGTPTAAYFVRAPGSGLPCTATTALGLQRDSGADRGASWARPQQVA